MNWNLESYTGKWGNPRMIAIESSLGRSVEGRVSDPAWALDQLTAAAKPGEYSDR